MMPIPTPQPPAVTVRQLKSGDVIRSGADSAIFIVHTQHPVPKYHEAGFRLVIWRLLTRGGNPGEYSFDTLLPDQEVGELMFEWSEAERLAKFDEAITP